MDPEKLYRLLRLGLEKGASDIHFQVGYLPLYRFHGDLVELPEFGQERESLSPATCDGDLQRRVETRDGGEQLRRQGEGRGTRHGA